MGGSFIKFKSSILFIIIFLLIPTFVSAKFLYTNDIVNRSYYLPIIGKTVMLHNGVYGNAYTPSTAWINSFLVTTSLSNLKDYNIAIVSMYESYRDANNAFATVRALVSHYDSKHVYLTNTIN